jgi:predicted transcriptional regulator
MYNDDMKRTTIMAPDELLDRLQAIARRENISLAEVIRQGLELRAQQAMRRPGFVASGRSVEPPFDAARRAGEMQPEPPSWR